MFAITTIAMAFILTHHHKTHSVRMSATPTTTMEYIFIPIATATPSPEMYPVRALGALEYELLQQVITTRYREMFFLITTRMESG